MVDLSEESLDSLLDLVIEDIDQAVKKSGEAVTTADGAVKPADEDAASNDDVVVTADETSAAKENNDDTKEPALTVEASENKETENQDEAYF